MVYLAAAAVIATAAAHESTRLFGLMVLLFLWMAWKRETGLAMLLIAGAGLCIYFLQDARQPLPHPMEGAYEGTLEFSDGAKLDGDRLRGFAEIEGPLTVYATYRIPDADEKEWIAENLTGTVFHIQGEFEAPSPPSHQYAFDMAAYLRNNGASSVLTVSGVHAAEKRTSLLIRLAKQRDRISSHIRETFPPSLLPEAEALLIGERELMTGEQRRTYETLGITHLFAISGLHVSIASGLVYFLLVRCRVRKESALAVMMVLLPLYAFLVGGAPSVWRAVGMAVAVFACRLFKVRIPIAHILFACFTVSILLNPYSIYKIGFQLSYGATFGIIYSLKILSASVSAIKTGFFITSISQLVLYPLLLLHFYEISLSAFAVNSLFVPLYTIIILPANFLLLALTALPGPSAQIFFSLYEPLRGLLESFMLWLASWPYQLWNPGKPEMWMMVCMFVSVFAFFCLAEKRFRPGHLLILIIPAITASVLPYMDGTLKVSFLDVGQGDSAVIELPHRQGVYVIDAGGVLRFEGEEYQQRRAVFEVGRQIVVPYLKGKGISSIDALILSHPDADHAEGAEEVLEEIRTGELHVTPGSFSTELMGELAPYVEGVDVFTPGAGSVWSKGEVDFLYLSPADHDYGGNDDSLVLLMRSGDFRVLFTGDLEERGEQDILARYSGLLADLTILKVGHHGSKTSSSEPFLRELSPALSIFSAGRDNRYNHPSPEVTERFDALSLPTLLTAESGTVEIEYGNGQWTAAVSR